MKTIFTIVIMSAGLILMASDAYSACTAPRVNYVQPVRCCVPPPPPPPRCGCGPLTSVTCECNDPGVDWNTCMDRGEYCEAFGNIGELDSDYY